MSDCCGNTGNVEEPNNTALPRKFSCPINKKKYVEVAKKTILQHIKSPWNYNLDEEKYYFCDDANCDVVYFGIKGSIISKDKIRIRIYLNLLLLWFN